jgi:hypothetical protein
MAQRFAPLNTSVETPPATMATIPPIDPSIFGTAEPPPATLVTSAPMEEEGDDDEEPLFASPRGSIDPSPAASRRPPLRTGSSIRAAFSKAARAVGSIGGASVDAEEDGWLGGRGSSSSRSLTPSSTTPPPRGVSPTASGFYSAAATPTTGGTPPSRMTGGSGPSSMVDRDSPAKQQQQDEEGGDEEGGSGGGGSTEEGYILPELPTPSQPRLEPLGEADDLSTSSDGRTSSRGWASPESERRDRRRRGWSLLGSGVGGKDLETMDLNASQRALVEIASLQRDMGITPTFPTRTIEAELRDQVGGRTDVAMD